MRGSPPAVLGLRSPPPRSAPPRAPARIQGAHKAAGRPRRAQRSRRPPRASPRSAPACRAAGPARGGSGQLKVKAEARRAWSSPDAGGAWRARGAGPRVCERRAPARPGQARWLRPPRSPASRVRPVRSLLQRFSPFFFFFRSAELMLVNKSLSLAAPLPPPPPLPHTGGRRARARARALAPAPPEPPPPQPRRAQGPAQPARAKSRSPGSQGRAERSRSVGCEAGRHRPRPRRRPRAPGLARARAPTLSPPPALRRPPLHAPSPPARLQKQCPRRRSGLGGGAARGEEKGRERGGRGVRGPRGSLKTTARLESAFPWFLKSFIVSCSCCKINK